MPLTPVSPCPINPPPAVTSAFERTSHSTKVAWTSLLASAASVPPWRSPRPHPSQSPIPPRLPNDPRKKPASIPTPKTLVAHLDQFVIGQTVAKRRLALGVSNHFKRLVNACDRDAPDPIVADADLRDVVVEKSNILLPAHGRPIWSNPWLPTQRPPRHR